MSSSIEEQTIHHRRGNTRCTNKWGVPYETVTGAIVAYFRDVLFRPSALRKLLEDEIERWRQEPGERQARLVSLQADLKRLDGELSRLADAVAVGGQIKALVERMQATQRQRDEVSAQLEHLEGQEQMESFDVEDWAEQVRDQLTDFVGTLEGNPVNGRIVLRGLLATPITLTPVLDGGGKLTDWDYMGMGTLDQLLSGRLSDPANPLPAWPADFIRGQPSPQKTVTKPNTTAMVPPGGYGRSATVLSSVCWRRAA